MLTEICKDKKKIQGKIYHNKHKAIRNAQCRIYHANNKFKMNAQSKAYYLKHKDEISNQNKINRIENKVEMRIKDKLYHTKHRDERNAQKRLSYAKHKDRIKAQLKEKYKTNINFQLNNKMSAIIRKSLKRNKNYQHWENIVGYTLDNLIKRLKKTLPKDYTWDDYINGKTDLHIDHIIPKIVFNFKSYTNIDFKRCWALKNLRLLPALENISKHAKLEKPFQPSLLL